MRKREKGELLMCCWTVKVGLMVLVVVDSCRERICFGDWKGLWIGGWWCWICRWVIEVDVGTAGGRRWVLVDEWEVAGGFFLEWCCGNGEGEMLVVVWRPVFMQAAPYGRKENEFSFKWGLSFGCWFLRSVEKKRVLFWSLLWQWRWKGCQCVCFWFHGGSEKVTPVFSIFYFCMDGGWCCQDGGWCCFCLECGFFFFFFFCFLLLLIFFVGYCSPQISFFFLFFYTTTYL